LEELHTNIGKFLPYFEDLRHRLYRGVLLFVTFFVGGFLSAGMILKNILKFTHVDGVTIATSSPFHFADLSMDIGFFLAIIVCVPYIIYSFYVFIVPALTKTERKRLLRTVPISIVLFLIGFAYGFFILYYSLELLASINIGLGIANIWNISQFLSQIFITAALLGLIFEFPLLLTLGMRLGLLTPQALKEKRRIAYFLIACITALLPPSDGLSLIAMSLPLVLLYEVTILLNLLNNKKKHVWIRS